MLRQILAISFLVLILSTSFAFRFGGGGTILFYIPGGTVFGGLKNINVPLLDIASFDGGIVAIGGYGYGGVPGIMYSGGFGFGGEREYTISSGTYKVSVGGGFGTGVKKLGVGTIDIFTAVGFGGLDISLMKKINEGNLGIGNLENGNLEGYLGASISYYALSLLLGLEIKLSEFAEIKAGGVGFVGYSLDGWTVNGKKLTGLTGNYNFLLSYALYAGVGFGF